MKTIKHQTGRTYNGAQVLVIHAPIVTHEDDAIDWVQVKFEDASRDIKGIVSLMVCEILSNDYSVGQSVMREYDAGRYSI